MFLVTLLLSTSFRVYAEPEDEAGADPLPGTFFALFGVTADGESDGTVGISLPDADDDGPLEYTVIADLRFDGQHVVWEEGPFEAQPGEYVPWTITLPEGAQFEDDQFDYLSDLVVTVQLLGSDLGYESTSAGYARIAFDWGGDPMVLLPDGARELAPGDAWNPVAPVRVERVDLADVPRPPPPKDPDLGPHSEEVDR